MRRPAPVTVWAAVFAGAGVYDLWCARNDVEGDSLSEVARALFRVHTPAGAAAFVAGWAGLTCWLVPHICRPDRRLATVGTGAHSRVEE